MSKQSYFQAGSALRPTKSTAKLRLLGLPVFYDVRSLAEQIHIDPALLKRIVRNPEGYYSAFYIPKKSGGRREIQQPTAELKAIQAWILRFILSKLSPTDYATAYRKGQNIADNVRPHEYNRHFLVVDIFNFFGSITDDRVERLYQILGYNNSQFTILTRLTTAYNSLPQGAVTSPTLSNLVAHHLDRRLSGFAAHRSAVFTRYADDITLSSNNRVNLTRAIPKVEKIVRECGFRLNKKKTRLLGPSIQCKITGLVKNSSEPSFAVGRKDKRLARAAMHRLATTGGLSAGRFPSVDSALGWLHFLKSVDEHGFERMVEYWNGLVSKYGSSNPNLVRYPG